MGSESDNLVDEALRRLKASDDSAALEMLRDAVERDPSNGRASGYLGIAQTRLGHYKAGIISLEQAALLMPEDFTWHYNLAVAYFRADRINDAREVLEYMLTFAPHNARVEKLLAKIEQYEKLAQEEPALTAFGSAADGTDDADEDIDQPHDRGGQL